MSIESADKKIKTITSYIQLVVLAATVVGFLGKIWWDVEIRKDKDALHDKQIVELTRGFQSLKERADHDKARINEKFSNISETVAIVKVIINNIEVQNLRLIAKQDKIYDMIYDQIKATKK